MKLKCTINMELMLIHSKTGKEIILKEDIEKEWDENSEEFKTLCRQYEIDTGLKRTVTNKDSFDKKLIASVLEQMKDNTKQTVEKVMNVVKELFLNNNKTGYIEFGGAVINVRDFSLIKINRFDSHCSKC